MPKYNRRFEKIDGILYEIWENRSGTETTGIEVCNYQDDDDDGMGEGCSACGNPAYPDCMSSCPLFDD